MIFEDDDGAKIRMMMRNSREKGCEEAAKEEGINISSFPKAPTSSRQWSGFRNPRIVRVSRSFGGKDRHSKVCTIRGLRDRRIRLSVPTAIQLYDLQDKLKLGQPSKVIDWLLDITKLDIDKLPPLQIPTAFSHPSSLFHQQMLFPTQYDHPYSTSTTTTTSSSPSQFCSLPPPSPFALHMKDSSSMSVANQTTTMGKSKLWDTDLAAVRATVLQEKASSATNKGKWIDGSSSSNTNQQVEDHYNEQISAQKLLSMPNSNAYNNNYNTCDNHQPSYLSLSQFGNNSNNGVFPSQVEAQTSSSSSSSLFFTPYASFITNPFESHIHFLSSNSHPLSNNNPFMPSSALHPFASHNLKPFPPPNFNLNKHLVHADNNNNDDSGKGGAGATGNSPSGCGR